MGWRLRLEIPDIAARFRNDEVWGVGADRDREIASTKIWGHWVPALRPG